MLGKIHFYLGILIIVVFLLTGQYMHHQHGHLADMDLMKRALFRAGHLYILLFGLINVALGTNHKRLKKDSLHKLQIFCSAIIIGSSILVIYAFFAELPPTQIERPLTRLSLYLILAGVSLNGIVYLFDRKGRTL
jgi:undecaprenyl pyrophosphate phosphatase UppP